MSGTDEMYLDNLEEYINDENKIVTYKWLCLTLNVKANEAKKMLFHFFENHKKSEKKYDLYVTYLVSGSLFDESLQKDVHKISIIKDSSLEEYKKKLSKMFSIHIYSLQRSNLKDLNLLYSVNYDVTRQNVFVSYKYSGITCPSIKTRTTTVTKPVEQIPKIEKSVPELKKPVPSKPSMFSNQTKESRSVKREIKSEDKENKISTGIIKESKPKPASKSNALASMFAKQPKITIPVKKENCTQQAPPQLKSEPICSPVKDTNSKLKKSSLAALVSSSKTKTKVLKTIIKEEEEEEEDDDDDDDITQIESPSQLKSSQKSSSKNKVSIKKKSSKRKTNKEDPLSSCKRRRIITKDSSSESSDEEERDCFLDEDPMPAPSMATLESDDDEMIPATPENSQTSKGRKGKMVVCTFEDDEGFCITKKEFVYTNDLSGDEEDPMPSPKKDPKMDDSPLKKPSSTKKKSSPKKKPVAKKTPLGTNTKQSSIMNFFKKK